MSEPYANLLLDRQGPILRVTLNRPEQLDALDEGLVGDLNHLLDALERDAATRVVVLRGAGRFIEPARAYELGRVSAVVVEAELDATVDALVDDLLRATSLALRMTKEALDFAVDMSGLESVMALEDRNQILGVQGEDFAEGVAAFVEKRAPHYRGT